MTDYPSRRLFLQRAATSGATIAAFGVSLPPSAAQGVNQPEALQGLPALDGSIVQDDAAIRAAGRDGGGMAQRRPRAVLKPGSVEDIVKIVRHANQRGVPIVMRGRGHARYGQSLVEGGIVIDSRSLAAVGKVAEGTIEVQAGASLESLVRAALDAGYALPVMTGCVMLSAGGFLSAGGQSRGSQRYGAFVDQVTELVRRHRRRSARHLFGDARQGALRDGARWQGAVRHHRAGAVEGDSSRGAGSAANFGLRLARDVSQRSKSNCVGGAIRRHRGCCGPKWRTELELPHHGRKLRNGRGKHRPGRTDT